MAIEVSAREQSAIDREFAGIVSKGLMGEVDRLPELFSCGPVYRFADRDYFATTLRAPTKTNQGILLRVFVHNGDSHEIDAYRAGMLTKDPHSSHFRGAGMATTRKRGDRLATLAELAYMAELAQHAARTGIQVRQHVINDLISTVDVEKDELRFTTDEAARQALQERIKRRESQERQAWNHMWGGGGVFGVGRDGCYVVEPTQDAAAMSGADEITLGREYAAQAGRAVVLRPAFLEGITPEGDISAIRLARLEQVVRPALEQVLRYT